MLQNALHEEDPYTKIYDSVLPPIIFIIILVNVFFRIVKKMTWLWCQIVWYEYFLNCSSWDFLSVCHEMLNAEMQKQNILIKETKYNWTKYNHCENKKEEQLPSTDNCHDPHRYVLETQVQAYPVPVVYWRRVHTKQKKGRLERKQEGAGPQTIKQTNKWN